MHAGRAGRPPLLSYDQKVSISTAPVLASRILQVLHEAGHTAYLVGGCVRDLLLDRPPKDFDVATSAPPAELLRLFPGSGVVGAHFGVVLVKDGEAVVEVATFRSDHAYRDGRHPESVTFEIDPRQDALRRDFTINAMMMDPRTGAVLDFAGGRADLEARLIRTVGEPLDRFGEDHLRLLRAVRFAARLGFEIEAGTFGAMRALAPRIRSVSAERVREELVHILVESGARRGVEMLRDSGLLGEILPEVVVDPPRLAMLAGLRNPSVPLAVAVLLLGVGEPGAVMERLRFSNDVAAHVPSLLANQRRFFELPGLSLSELKRFLRMPGFGDHLELHRLYCEATGAGPAGYELARAKAAAFSQEELFPPRLLTGDDLIAMGLKPGPEFKRVLDSLETAQLEGSITNREEAVEHVKLGTCADHTHRSGLAKGENSLEANPASDRRLPPGQA
jgi:poly(A) polymerase